MYCKDCQGCPSLGHPSSLREWHLRPIWSFSQKLPVSREMLIMKGIGNHFHFMTRKQGCSSKSFLQFTNHSVPITIRLKYLNPKQEFYVSVSTKNKATSKRQFRISWSPLLRHVRLVCFVISRFRKIVRHYFCIVTVCAQQSCYMKIMKPPTA